MRRVKLKQWLAIEEKTGNIYQLAAASKSEAEALFFERRRGRTADVFEIHNLKTKRLRKILDVVEVFPGP